MNSILSNVRIGFLMATFYTFIDNNRASELVMPFQDRIPPSIHFSFAYRTTMIHTSTKTR